MFSFITSTIFLLFLRFFGLAVTKVGVKKVLYFLFWALTCDAILYFRLSSSFELSFLPRFQVFLEDAANLFFLRSFAGSLVLAFGVRFQVWLRRFRVGFGRWSYNFILFPIVRSVLFNIFLCMPYVISSIAAVFLLCLASAVNILLLVFLPGLFYFFLLPVIYFVLLLISIFVIGFIFDLIMFFQLPNYNKFNSIRQGLFLQNSFNILAFYRDTLFGVSVAFWYLLSRLIGFLLRFQFGRALIRVYFYIFDFFEQRLAGLTIMAVANFLGFWIQSFVAVFEFSFGVALHLFFGDFNLHDADTVNFFYFRTRCVLSVFLFCLGFFPLHFVFLVLIYSFISFLALCVLYYDVFAFLYIIIGFVQVLGVGFYCVLPSFRTAFNKLKLSRVAFETFMYARSFSCKGKQFVHYLPESRRGPALRIDLRTEIHKLRPEDRERVLDATFWRYSPFMQFMLIWCVCLASVYYSFVAFTEFVVFPVMKLPLRFLRGLFFASFAFVIPSIWFDLVFASLTKVCLVFELDPVLCFWSFVEFLNAFCKMTGLSVMYGVSYLEELGDLSPKTVNRTSQIFFYTWVSFTRRYVLKFVEGLDNMRLPEMVQAQYQPPTVESLRSTYVFLKEIGFPVDQSFIDSLDRPEASSYLVEWGGFRNWLLGSSSFSLGFRKVRLTQHEWLPREFFPSIPGFIHSTSFTGVREEILSNARYYTGSTLRHVDDLEGWVSDLFEVVKPQYAFSRLVSFDLVFRKWTKRFNMGFGFGKFSSNGRRLLQLSRQSVINAFGGKVSFMTAWAEIFRNAQRLVMPSPVFTKWETLKLSKAISRSVRTVVGSAFTHHVMSTVFNHAPNHNYHVWETPMKVGMPINGQNFDRLWSSLLAHEKVFAGDMTAFDSSQPPIVIKLVAELRKKGFEYHKDYHKICQLIDISYDMLLHQPMGFKNFGDIASKEQGFTTGHSSTTPDNSLALVANYLFAWRKVTGLRAREFQNFNTLANFGDDHVLGYDPVYGWCPEAAMEAMAELGTKMRDEAPGQTTLPNVGMTLPTGVSDVRDLPFGFLSKHPLPLDADVLRDLQRAGVTVPLNFATCHNRKKLIGKIKGTLVKSHSTPEKSYQALISYLYLCAHHKDIFDYLAGAAGYHYRKYKSSFKKNGFAKTCPKPPSYNQVIRAWYSAAPFPYSLEQFENEDEGSENLQDISLIMNPDPFGVFVRWLSDFPSLLSPRYTNMRWADWLQRKLGAYLSWPLTLLATTHGKLNDVEGAKLLLSRTPYAFLRNPTIQVRPLPFHTLIVRHWLFVAFVRLVIPKRVTGFSFLDLFRVLDHFWIGVIFVLFGRVTELLVELDLHLLESLVIFLLDFVHVPSVFPFTLLRPIRTDLLSPSVWAGVLITYLFGYVSPAGAIDFQPFDQKVLRLSFDPVYRFGLNAPTGIGKSTRLVARLQSLSKRRVVVIVPRHLVAKSVGTYMRALYPDAGIGISTEGETFLSTDTIVYATVQSYFANPKLRSFSNILVLDEAHISEPHYIVMRNYLQRHLDLRQIWVTATPLPDFPVKFFTLPSVSSFKVDHVSLEVETLTEYLDSAVVFTNGRLSFEKVLIFVPSLKNQDYLVNKIRNKCCLLSSKDREIDQTASVFITTSVSDAGVTIPDVSFVLTPNVDIYVTSVSSSSGFVSRPYYAILPYHTLKQRAGRTGRTSHGTFLKYSIKNVETQELDFSLPDFLEGLRPATQFTLPYFPDKIKLLLPEEMVPALKLYDGLKTFGLLDLQHFLLTARDSNLTPFELAQHWASDPNFKYYSDKVTYDPAEVPDFNRNSTLDPKNVFVPTKSPVVSQAQISEPEVQVWHECPGTLVQSGYSALAGIIATSRGFKVSPTFIEELCSKPLYYNPIRTFGFDTNESISALFEITQFSMVALFYFNLNLTLTNNGDPSRLAVPFNPMFGSGNLKKLRNRFSYFGNKLTDQFEDRASCVTHIERVLNYRCVHNIPLQMPGCSDYLYFYQKFLDDRSDVINFRRLCAEVELSPFERNFERAGFALWRPAWVAFQPFVLQEDPKVSRVTVREFWFILDFLLFSGVLKSTVYNSSFSRLGVFDYFKNINSDYVFSKVVSLWNEVR